MTKKMDDCKDLKTALDAIEKRFGQGAVLRLNDQANLAVPFMPTGVLSLDVALGVGGLPKGRIIEIFGPEASGKTTLTLHVIAACQKLGGTCAFIDAEHALDAQYAQALGVRLDELLVSQPDCGEQALDIAEMLARSGAVDLVVIDSVAALTPRAEIEGQMGDQHMGLQARLMSQALRKLTASVHRADSMVIFINQLRQKIGVTFGSNETTPGGNALKFYASVRLDVRRIGALREGDEVLGNRTRIKVVKNKVAPPFTQVETDLYFGVGICPAADLIERGLEVSVFEKRGSFYRFDGDPVGQGKNAVRERLLADPELFERVKSRVLAALAAAKGAAGKPGKSIDENDENEHEALLGGAATERFASKKSGGAKAA